MSGRVTVIAVPLPMLFIIARVQAAMIPAVLRVDMPCFLAIDSIVAV